MPKKGTYIAIIIGVIAAGIAISVAALMSAPTGSTVLSAGVMPAVLSIDSEPYGKSYGEWTGEVWQHFQQIPFETNPANDSTGEFCDLSQDDPNVWFIHSSFGGLQVRECTVPADRSLVILLAGVSCSYAEDPTLQTPEDLRRCAEENVGDMTLRASINGNRIPNVEEYYSVSPVLPVTLPEGNVWDVQGPVDTEFVAAGWTLVTDRLAPGEYRIETSAEERQFVATGEPVWSTAVEYRLTVIEG